MIDGVAGQTPVPLSERTERDRRLDAMIWASQRAAGRRLMARLLLGAVVLTAPSVWLGRELQRRWFDVPDKPAPVATPHHGPVLAAPKPSP